MSRMGQGGSSLLLCPGVALPPEADLALIGPEVAYGPETDSLNHLI
jgi:hypothetical protein